MGWEVSRYTLTDDFDADFGVEEWHGTNVFLRAGEQVFRTYFVNNRGDEALGSLCCSRQQARGNGHRVHAGPLHMSCRFRGGLFDVYMKPRCEPVECDRRTPDVSHQKGVPRCAS
jgi:hypothetical protein